MKSRVFYILVIMLVLFGAQWIYADTIEMKISDGTNTVTIQDNVAPDGSPTTGIISYVGNVGAWNVVIGIGEGSALLGSGDMDLTFNAVSALGTTSTLTFSLTQYGMSGPLEGWKSSIGGTLSTIAISQTEWDVYYDSGNVKYGTATHLLSDVFTTSSFNLTQTSNQYISGGPFSLTQVIAIKGNGKPNAVASGNANLTEIPVPEPSVLLLLGSGITAVSLVLRRRS